MWTLLMLIGTIIFLVWCLSSPFYWRKRNVPYLLPLPLFGNFLSILKYGTYEYNRLLYKLFPDEPFYGLHFFTRPALVVKDPDLIQRILVTDFEHFTSHGFYSNQDRDPAGGNLFHVYGQQWKELRGKLSHYFTPSKIKGMLNYADGTIKKSMDTIDCDISNSRPTDVMFICSNISTDIITKSLFGIETDIFSNSNSECNNILHDMTNRNFLMKLYTSVIFPKLYELLKLRILSDSDNRKVIEMVSSAVEFRRKQNVRNMNDFVEGMMELADNYEVQERKYFPDNTQVPKYDLKTLISQAMVLFTAGTETMASTIAFLLYELALHPEIQERCREEVNAVAKESGGQINAGDLSKLVYLGAAIQETLRLYTSLPFLNRSCTRDYRIPGTEVTLEKGTFVILLSDVHRDAKYYSEPDVFNPERYMNGSKIKSGTYMPFGLGPRICLGMGFANAVVKLVAARLLLRYEFAVCDKTDIPLKISKFTFIRKPLNGVILNACPIQS